MAKSPDTKKSVTKTSKKTQAAAKSKKKTTKKSEAKSAPDKSKSTSPKSKSSKSAEGGKGKAKASADAKYTKPDLREKIKDKIMKSDKGGRPGQWSARKAQLVATEYKHEGGGYKGGPGEKQQHLKDWGDEKWRTEHGDKAIQGKETHRYLPDKAWNELSAEEKKKTDRKKVEGSRKGKQFVKNTPGASKAGAKARTHKKAKSG